MTAPLSDIVVVGGGLIGCACTYALAKRGLRVTLIERGDLGEGASGACDGHVCCQSKAPGFHLALAQRSLSLHALLPEELAEETGFRRCGSWLIAETEEECRALQGAAEASCAAGLPASIHEDHELRQAEPLLGERAIAGSYCPTDAQTDPWLTLLALARAARRLGATLELGVEVTGLNVRAGRVTGVNTTDGPRPCGAVLLAAGAWTTCLSEPLGVALPLRPRRGEILVTEAMPPLLSSIILHTPYLATKFRHEEDRPATLVLEQTLDGNLLLGSTRSFTGFDPHSTPEGIAAISREAARLAPGLADLHVIRSFAGLRPCSGDGLPLVGPVSGVEGLLVAAGHEGDGVALAPITGEIVAQCVLGEQPWPTELSPARFA